MGVSIKRNNYLDCFEKIGIFAGSLLVTASAVYFYSPVFKSNADDSDESRVKVTINPVASLALDTNNLNFSVIPTDAGTFASQAITATVSTNSTAGYELYFSAEDNSTDMTHSDSNVSSVIASDFSGTVTSSTMAKNKWGYSLDNTDFLKIPTLNNQTKIKDLDHYPSAIEKNTAVYIGTKISSDLPSGRYSKNVEFSVLAHDIPVTMQSFSCSKLPNIGDSMTLQDERDGKSYTVARLADNQCWMTSDLRVGYNQYEPPAFVMNENTTDLSGVSTFSLLNTDSGFRNNQVDYMIVENDNISAGYYTFNAATAGWGSNSSGNFIRGNNSIRSICPAGWRLPTGGPDSDFSQLITLYSGTLSQVPFNANLKNTDAYQGTLQEPGKVP